MMNRSSAGCWLAVAASLAACQPRTHVVALVDERLLDGSMPDADGSEPDVIPDPPIEPIDSGVDSGAGGAGGSAASGATGGMASAGSGGSAGTGTGGRAAVPPPPNPCASTRFWYPQSKQIVLEGCSFAVPPA